MRRVLSPIVFLWAAALLLSPSPADAQNHRSVGGNQHPVMKGEMEGALPLVKVGGR